MGSAAESTAVTHLTSISAATAQQLCTTRAEAAPAAAAPRAGTSPAERAGVAGRRSGADAPLESSAAKLRAPCAARTGGCAFLSQPSGPGLLPGHRAGGQAGKAEGGAVCGNSCARRGLGRGGRASRPRASSRVEVLDPGRSEDRGMEPGSGTRGPQLRSRRAFVPSG